MLDGRSGAGRGRWPNDARPGRLSPPGPRAAPTAIIWSTRATQTARFIVVGGGTNTGGGYSDIDMMFTPDGSYVHKDGDALRVPTRRLRRA